MGGYGAVKWALRRPGRFAAAASLSGALDMGRRSTGEPMLRRVFGDDPIAGTDNDLLWLLGQAASVPRLYFCCGTEDHLYSDNLTFVDACRSLGIAAATDFGPGRHDWAYWDAKIQDVLAWMFDKR
jgi:putative tributyrin esterase